MPLYPPLLGGVIVFFFLRRTGSTVSTSLTLVREARRLTGLTGKVTSLDECEELGVSEDKWRWKARGNVGDR